MALSSKPTTILQVLPALKTGGAEQTTLDISKSLLQAGYRSCVASAGGRMQSQLESDGASHVTLPLDRKNPLALWRNYRALVTLIKRENIALIHARSRGPAWSALWAARKLNIPFVTTYHGSYTQTNKLKAFYNSVMARGDVVIANSNWTAQHIRNRNPLSAHRIEVIYRGTDFSVFEKDNISEERQTTLKAQWGIQPKHFTVLQLARMARWKGHQVVIETAAKLVAEFPNLRFVLAGDHAGRADYVAELQQEIDDLGLKDHVTLAGHCNDPSGAMAVADAVLVASTQAEAFGRAAVEACALETPVIVTRIGAAQETVLAEDEDDAFTGWKAEPGDPISLARSLREVLLLNDKAKAVVTKRARKRVVTEFSLQQMCDKTLAIYDRLLRKD